MTTWDPARRSPKQGLPTKRRKRLQRGRGPRATRERTEVEWVFYEWAKGEVRRRSRGACEARFARTCTGRASDQYGPHHRREQSDGGTDEPDNLVDLCANCHDAIHHQRPAEAVALGLLIR